MGKVEGKGKGGELKRKEKGNMRYESKAKQIRTGIQGCRALNGAGIWSVVWISLYERRYSDLTGSSLDDTTIHHGYYRCLTNQTTASNIY